MLETRGGVADGPAGAGWVNGKGNGKIINLSSLVAFQGGLNVVAYSAAKHGVQGIVRPPLLCHPFFASTHSRSEADKGLGQVLFQWLDREGSQCQRHRTRVYQYGRRSTRPSHSLPLELMILSTLKHITDERSPHCRSRAVSSNP